MLTQVDYISKQLVNKFTTVGTHRKYTEETTTIFTN